MEPTEYKIALTKAMSDLSKLDETIFIGQQIIYAGNPMSTTLDEVPKEKMIEVPVMEETQMGMSLGLALDGKVPISIFPRWNFLLCGINQLINHIDKVEEMSSGGYKPKIIIRTGIGSIDPLHPQSQHVGDFTDAIRAMATTIDIIRLEEPEEIFPAYEKAYLRNDGRTTICVEYGDYYNQK